MDNKITSQTSVVGATQKIGGFDQQNFPLRKYNNKLFEQDFAFVSSWLQSIPL
jgi:hypothetical protein